MSFVVADFLCRAGISSPLVRESVPPAFGSPETADIARSVILRLTTDRDVEWITATVMPDHVHLLFELGNRLELDRLVAKLKGLIARKTKQAALWQENAFEPRLRADESLEAYGLYIYMNPYRAGLVGVGKSWPWWICTATERLGFWERTRAGGVPQPEWLIDEALDGEGEALVTGE